MNALLPWSSMIDPAVTLLIMPLATFLTLMFNRSEEEDTPFLFDAITWMFARNESVSMFFSTKKVSAMPMTESLRPALPAVT
jgi:hypothetical protein